MIVDVYFRGELRATGQTPRDNDYGEIAWSGPGADEVEAIADHLARHDGASGVALLRRLVEKLHGHWQARARSD